MGLRRENSLPGSLINTIFQSSRKKIDSAGVSLYYLSVDDERRTSGVVYRKVGKAVTRNHIKRVMRNFIADNLGELKNGYYFWVIKEYAADEQLKSALLHILLKGKLLKNA